ncbi:hypothetical protein AWB71_00681 [Caballeronia peredens]|nr:hypothetical protein AWB71_00681 [Caballeronia peredens]
MNLAEQEFRRFGNLIARSRRDALRIIADDRTNRRHRLSLIGERLLGKFSEIDACTTREQRLMLIGANPADARDVRPGKDSMLHLVWAESLEWSAMRRRDDGNDMPCAPLYWCVGFVMIEEMCSPEAATGVDQVFRRAFGCSFDEWAGGDDE